MPTATSSIAKPTISSTQRREFLGDVRCIVFEVSAKKGTGNGRFHGRIWVEDQDYNIVRLKGTYEPRSPQRLLLPHG